VSSLGVRRGRRPRAGVQGGTGIPSRQRQLLAPGRGRAVTAACPARIVLAEVTLEGVLPGEPWGLSPRHHPGGPPMCPRAAGDPPPNTFSRQSLHQGACGSNAGCSAPSLAPHALAGVPWGGDGAWPASPIAAARAALWYQRSRVTHRGVWWLCGGGRVPGGFVVCGVPGGRTGSESGCCWVPRGVCRVRWLGWARLGAPRDGMLSTALACLRVGAVPPWLCLPSPGLRRCCLPPPAAPLAPTLAPRVEPPSPAQWSAGRGETGGLGAASGTPCLRAGPGRAGYPGGCPDAQVPGPQLWGGRCEGWREPRGEKQRAETPSAWWSRWTPACRGLIAFPASPCPSRLSPARDPPSASLPGAAGSCQGSTPS